MVRGRGMDTSTGTDSDARNAPTPDGAVSSSIPIVLPPENLLLEMDVDTRVRPYQPGRDTGYIIGGGAAPPTLLIPLLDQPSGRWFHCWINNSAKWLLNKLCLASTEYGSSIKGYGPGPSYRKIKYVVLPTHQVTKLSSSLCKAPFRFEELFWFKH